MEAGVTEGSAAAGNNLQLLSLHSMCLELEKYQKMNS